MNYFLFFAGIVFVISIFFLKKSNNIQKQIKPQVREAENIKIRPKRLSKRELAYKKFEIRIKKNAIYTLLMLCLEELLRIENVYFTYEQHISVIRINLKELIEIPKDKLYVSAEKLVIKSFKKYHERKITMEMKLLIEDPIGFYKNINHFHKQQLLKSIDPFYDMWYKQVSQLKQKPAKSKRQQYVIDGYVVMRKELVKIGATASEINLVDQKLLKLTNENWTLI